MQFKIAVVGNQMFGDISLIAPEQNQKKIEDDKEKFAGFKDEKLKKLLETGAGDKQMDSQIVVKDIQGGNEIKYSSLRDIAKQYIKALALAHQVMPDVDKNGKKVYLGPSPDEITLVDGAKQMGYEFIKATQSDAIVNILGKDTSFQLLEVFEFNSDRKRMSVVIKDNGVLKLYMKGADSIVLKRVAKDNKLSLNSQLERFSLIGLRTLLIAMKTVSQDEYNKFKAERLKLKGLAPAEKEKA